MTNPVALVAVALLIAGLAGCGEEESQGRDDAAVTLDDLDRRVFGSGRVSTGHRLVDGTEVTLGFEGTELSAYAGCNHLFGTASIDGDTLHARALSGTEMGCARPLADQDAWLQEFLSAGPTVVLDGGVLTLTSGGTTLELTEEPAPDRGDQAPGDDPVSDDEVASVG
jgi:heat shock protein HslJ